MPRWNPRWGASTGRRTNWESYRRSRHTAASTGRVRFDACQPFALFHLACVRSTLLSPDPAWQRITTGNAERWEQLYLERARALWSCDYTRRMVRRYDAPGASNTRKTPPAAHGIGKRSPAE